jgi:rRNA-processing protein FCF1
MISMNKKPKSPVILDTNALLAQFQFKIDLESELLRLMGSYEIFIPDTVLDELKNIKDKDVKAARKMAEKYEVVYSEKKGDEAILDLAEKMKAVVVTNDQELRKRLKKQGLKVVYLRQKSHLVVDNP